MTRFKCASCGVRFKRLENRITRSKTIQWTNSDDESLCMDCVKAASDERIRDWMTYTLDGTYLLVPECSQCKSMTTWLYRTKANPDILLCDRCISMTDYDRHRQWVDATTWQISPRIYKLSG